MGKESVRFSSMLAYVGILAGVAIALLLPYIILVYGSHISEGLQFVLIIIALGGGGVITLTAAFFGIVIPKKINDKGEMSINVVKDDNKKTVSINRQSKDENSDDNAADDASNNRDVIDV